jgi:hypothetical protein
VAWPLAAHAQQSERMRRIGVLMGYAESDREGQAFLATGSRVSASVLALSTYPSSRPTLLSKAPSWPSIAGSWPTIHGGAESAQAAG